VKNGSPMQVRTPHGHVGKHLSHRLVEGYRPGSRTASNQGRRQREMARAAEDDGSRLNQFPPGRTQPSIPSSPIPTMDSHRCNTAAVSLASSAGGMRKTHPPFLEDDGGPGARATLADRTTSRYPVVGGPHRLALLK